MKGGLPSILALLLTTVAAASAVPAPVAVPGPDVRLGDLATDPLGVGAALAAATAQGTGSEVLQAWLRHFGHDDAPLPLAVREVPGAPAHLALPLGRIAAAMDLAEQLRAEATAALSEEERAFILEHGLREAAPLPLPAVPELGEGMQAHVAGLSASSFARVAGYEAIAAKVDAAKLRVAALTLVAAIEASAPELRAAALLGGAGVDSHCGVGGPVAFESSGCEVVVGDAGANAYGPAASGILLLVDLGGNDVYTNGAALAKSSVRVLVDNAGNDAYTVARSGAGAGASATAEGIAFAAIGVAVLADLGGSDLYSASAVVTAPQPGPAAGTARVTGIGFANIGAAVLLDAGGRDTFTSTATSSGGPAAVSGQGAGGVGLAAIVNLGNDGAGDDLYSSRPTSTLHLVTQTPNLSQYTIGPADTDVQGAADLAAVALLADVGGDDTYLALPTGATANLLGQGAGNGGAGALADAGGNDALTARALGDTTLSLIVNNGGAAVCWTVTVTVTTGETKAFAQGAANTVAGVLLDAGGNDVRVLEARGNAGAIGGVNTTFNCGTSPGNRVTTTATSGPGTAEGHGSGNVGVGALIDLAGADTNTLRGVSTALASSVINGPGSKFETATATAGTGRTFGQAHSSTGIGLLADAAGADGYVSTTASTATRITSAGTSVTVGPTLQEVHAFGRGGLAWLLDLDGADAYVGTSPAANNKCWANGVDGGRGRDVSGAIAVVTTPGCP